MVNLAAAKGRLKVQVEDPSGKPIDGFALAESLAVQGDGVALAVRWHDKESLAALAGRPVRLNFQMSDASLYGFEIV